MALLSNGMPIPFFLRVLIPRTRPVPQSPPSVTEENASSSSSSTQALRVKSPSELNTNDPLPTLSLNTVSKVDELINEDFFDEEDPLISSSTDLSPRPMSPGSDAFIPSPEEETESKEKLMDPVHGEDKMEEDGKPVLPGKKGKRKKSREGDEPKRNSAKKQGRQKATSGNGGSRKSLGAKGEMDLKPFLHPLTSDSVVGLHSNQTEANLSNLVSLELKEDDLNGQEDDFGLNSTVVSASCVGTGALKNRKMKKTRFQCGFCTFSTNSARPFNRHLTTHTGLLPFACDICNKRCATKCGLTKHKNWHAGLASANTGSETAYQCGVCAYSTNLKFAFERHLTSHTGRPFACDICEKRFATKYELLRHKNTHTGLKPCVCEMCGKDFSRDSYLLEHQRRHHPRAKGHDGNALESLKCERCGKGLPTKYQLNVHLKGHSTGRANRCHICGLAFWFPSTLKNHLKRHEPKSLPCAQCGRVFATPQDRKTHEAQHTGEKPHACNVCGAAFVRRSYLENHIRIHTGEKPFKCVQCGKSFAQSGALKNHIKNIHGLRT